MGAVPEVERIEAACKSLAGWWLLLWEATDLGAQIYDTPDLSIVRGGSVVLDTLGRAVPELLQKLGATKVIPIATSASRALVLVAGDGPAAARNLVDGLRAPPWWLRSGAQACPFQPGDFERALAGLEADILRQRLRNLDVASGVLPGLAPVPQPGESPRSRLDPKDLVRARYGQEEVRVATGVDPVVLTATQQDGQGERRELLLNPINAARFRVGQRARWDLLRSLREHRPSVDEVEARARRYPEDEDVSRRIPGSFVDLARRSRLPGYLGLIEADGRGFGRFFRGLKRVKDYALGSAVVESAIRELLRAVLREELDELANSDALPAILLVQAGDDLHLVTRSHRALPAAMGLVTGWRDAVKAAASGLGVKEGWVEELAGNTLDVGVVISHADTPVRHLRAAAGALLDHVKREADGRADAATIAWALLKSHDVLPGGVVSAAGPTASPMHAPELAGLVRFTEALKRRGCPRGPLKRVWEKGGPPGFTGEAAQVVEEVRAAFGSAVGDDEKTWKVVDELWEVVE